MVEVTSEYSVMDYRTNGFAQPCRLVRLNAPPDSRNRGMLSMRTRTYVAESLDSYSEIEGPGISHLSTDSGEELSASGEKSQRPSADAL